MTARGDVSTTTVYKTNPSPVGTLNRAHFTCAQRVVGDDNAHKDKYRKVRFYQENGTVKVEWPFLGYDS